MAKYKVLVADKLNEEGLRILEGEKDVESIYAPGLSEDELCERVKGVHALIVRSGVKVTARVIESSDSLKVIGRAGIGVDNIDVKKATEKGIVVMNNPSGNAITTAEHTIALLFSLARKIPQAHLSLTQGKWEKTKFEGIELTGKTLGIIGLGNIGKIVAEKAKGLGMKVIAHDPFVSVEVARNLQVELVSLEELLANSDVVTLHVPKTDSTKNLLNKENINKMKKGALLINCARGGIVDEMAVAEALRDGRLGGAAFDVFEKEPPPPDHPLFKLPNVVCTPHLGASTKEAQINVSVGIVNQIIDYLKRGIVRYAVNIPSIPPEIYEPLKPYIYLAEKIGCFIAQMRDDGITDVHVHYMGEISKLDTTFLNLSLMKGILSPALGEIVTLVNAQILFKERGIRFTESKTKESQDFTSLIQVKVKRGSVEDSVSGTIFGKNMPKIVGINDFYLEADPEGNIIMLENYDRPGVIGNIGTYLGKKGINIAHMKIGRDRPGGKAISIIHIDSPLDREIIENLKKIENIINARYLKV